MGKMTGEEVQAFLAGPPVRTGKLATVRADGRAHVAPIWFDVQDDGSVYFNTGHDTVKGRNLVRNGRAALCVDDERPPFAFVVIEGPVEISEEPELLVRTATRIAARYMGDEHAEEYGGRNGVPGELVVRLLPEHVNALKNLTE